MKPAKIQWILPFLSVLAVSTLPSACAGKSPKPIPVGPVPNANGLPDSSSNPSGDSNGGLQSPPVGPLGDAAVGNAAGTLSFAAGNGAGTLGIGNSAGTFASVVAAGQPPPVTQPPAMQPVSPAQPPANPAPVTTEPANCTTYYRLGYGDAYRSGATGPWLAKSNSDYTVPCAINAPACTANNGDGLGTQFTVPGHGKMTLAKLTDANKGMEDVCIVARLTGT